MADSLARAKGLVEELVSQRRAKANNVVLLLGILSSSKQEATTKAVVQGLKQFFVAEGHEGQLVAAGTASSSGEGDANKRRKLDGGSAASDDGPEAQYRSWLGRQYLQYRSHLLDLLSAGGEASSCSAAVQVVAAAALMECVRCERGPGGFAAALFARLLTVLLTRPGVRPEVFSLFFNKYLPLADVRFYTLSVLRALAAKHALAPPPAEGRREGEAAAAADDPEAAAAAADMTAVAASASSSGDVDAGDLARNAFDVLCHIQPLSSDASDLQSWCGAVEFSLVAAAPDKNESSKQRRKRQAQEHAAPAAPSGSAAPSASAQQQRAQWANPKAHKRVFGDAWLAFLSLPLPPDILRKALVKVPGSVIPHMHSPHLLSDLMTHAIGAGGLTGMLALNGVFVLVTRHGLEYPAFYARLYQLLTQEAFASRHRGQFFRLADIFLASGLVPAYTAAAFAKRFARLAMAAPPAGAMVAIAFVHNLVRRHPSLMVLLHSPSPPRATLAGVDGDEEEAEQQQRGGGCPDPYDDQQPDPAKSRAVDSSLWELACLRNHYCPQVSAFASILDKDLGDRTKTSEVDLEPLLGGAGAGAGGAPGAGGSGAGSYGALLHSELERKLRRPPPTAFYARAPKGLFDSGEGGPDAGSWGGWCTAAPAAAAAQ